MKLIIAKTGGRPHELVSKEDNPHSVTGGSAIILPAGIPHAVAAVTPFKMLLTVVKES